MNKYVQQLLNYLKDNDISNERIQIVTKENIFVLSKDTKIDIDWQKGIISISLCHKIDKYYNVKFMSIIDLKQKQILKILINNRGDKIES